MNILFVSRSNSNKPHAFIKEQADAIVKNHEVNIDHFLINSGGVLGYAKAIKYLFKYLKINKVDLIHIHYGLWGFVAVFNTVLFHSKTKLIITFHGSDINKRNERKVSLLASYFSAYNILVSEKMCKYFKNNFSVIPCGIDVDIRLDHRDYTRQEKGWDDNDFIILFSSSFDRKVKDPDFAWRVIDMLSKSVDRSVKFIELRGYTRSELTGIMQAADVLLMCSISEGSPQVIKEAILNSLPVVSNDIGEVKSICSGIDNCFVITKDVNEYVRCLKFISERRMRVQNRDLVIKRFDNNTISKKILEIYKEVLKLN